MAGPLDAPAPGQTEIERLLADPAFREFLERGSPAIVVSVADRAVAWANGAARRAFGGKLESISARLLSGAASGAAPRLQRLLIESGESITPLSFLTKRAAVADGREMLVAALLGAEPAAMPQSEPAPAAADVKPPETAAAAPAEAAEPPERTRTAEDVRTELLKTHRNPTIRFLWQTDASGRVTSLTPSLGEIVGAQNADFLGEELAHVVDRLHLDPSGKLLSAMRVPETWSGIEVAWPIASAAAAVLVDLGGFPVFAGRIFRGFRGFGVIHLDRIREAEPVILRSEPEPERSPIEEADSQAASSVEESIAPEPAEAGQPEPALPAANVVPLRPFAALAAAFGLRSPVREPSASTASLEESPVAEDAGSELSESEHQAFDEIARRLNEESPAEPRPRETRQPAPANDTVSIIDRLPLAVLISRNETPVYANRMLLELTGYSSIEQVQAAGGLAQLFEGPRLTETGAATAAIRTRHGNLIPVESKLQAISWEGQPASLLTLRRGGEGAHFAGAKTLELELQHREAELRELRAVLDTATDGVAILDPDGRILSLNHPAEALFGYQQNEVAGEPFTMLFASESRRLVDDLFVTLQSGAIGGSAGNGRAVYAIARSGATIPISLTLGRIGGDHRARKFCAVIRDTSAWKHAEQEAREAREEAERASAIKSDFLAKVSHEIRTPLNAIIGFAEVIMDERLGPIGTERYKDYLRDIHRSGSHVMSLVNDLLDLSKIEAGKMVLDIKSVDANAVISECVALMQPQANRERVIMRLALGPRLAQIAADERSLRQIVLNLLSNAVKYNEPGGQVIVSTAMNEAGHAVIRIKDTGIGMSDAELAVALEPFRQVATARPVSGTGLGLPLTKALIEANRANFMIRSRKNEGTLVEVTFPPARVLAESA